MNIAILTSELYPVFSGGLGVATYEIVKNSRKVNKNINFIVGMPELDWNGKLDAEIIQVPHKLSFHTYTVTSELSRANLDWNDYLSIHEFNYMLFEMLKNKDIDIVHANDWMSVPAGLLMRQHGKKFIFHVHSTEYDRTNGNPRDWVVTMERVGMKFADGIITTSHQMKAQLIEKYGADKNKIYVLYNGINVAKFRQHIHLRHKSPDEKIVLFVGRLTIQKGLWELMHVARKVVNKDPRIKFLIVGGGDSARELINLSLDLGLQDHVIFTGRIPEKELLAAYRISDLFVMPSVSEPFGLVALEAMASGKPILVSKTSGVSEVIKHRLSVDYWDTDMMASKILEAINYPDLSESLVENGSREVEKMDWTYSVKRLHKIYERVLNG